MALPLTGPISLKDIRDECDVSGSSSFSNISFSNTRIQRRVISGPQYADLQSPEPPMSFGDLRGRLITADKEAINVIDAKPEKCKWGIQKYDPQGFVFKSGSIILDWPLSYGVFAKVTCDSNGSYSRDCATVAHLNCRVSGGGACELKFYYVDTDNQYRSMVEVIGWQYGWRNGTSQSLYSSESDYSKNKTINFNVPSSHTYVTICFNNIIRLQTTNNHEIFILTERKGSSLTNNWNIVDGKLK